MAETLFWANIVDIQLRQKHGRHYNEALDRQPAGVRPTLDGCYGCVTGSLTRSISPGTCRPPQPAAKASLPNGPGARSLLGLPVGSSRMSVVTLRTCPRLQARDVVKVLLSVVTCLGQASAGTSMAYDQDHPSV